MTVYQLTFRCPDLKTIEDAEIIKASLMDSPGFSDIDIDWRGGYIRAATANQDAGRDLIARLSKAGFPCTD
ncbi:MAG TPA: hypothetical protein VK934_07925 [Fimbriimonas sp.]|nr:hypothetical protein [Fimbriimonas sp.]